MSYAFEESPEELEPQAAGSRRGRPPDRGTVVDLLDQPDRPVPERLAPHPLKKIAAILGLSVLLLAIGLMLSQILWPR
jgi:hypothetical protein